MLLYNGGDGAVWKDTDKDIGNCDVMDSGSLLIGEIETGHPELLSDLGSPCERVGMVAKSREREPSIGPSLAQEDIDGVLLKTKTTKCFKKLI